MLKDLRNYVGAILGHWVALVMGSTLFAALTVWEHRTNMTLPWPFYASLLVIMFFVSSFQAWCDENHGRLAALAVNAQRATQRATLRTKLQELLGQGEVMANRGSPLLLMDSEANSWHQAIDTLLAPYPDLLGIYRATGLPRLSFSGNHSKIHNQLEALRRIIADLKD